jgi:hypothetical protein
MRESKKVFMTECSDSPGMKVRIEIEMLEVLSATGRACSLYLPSSFPRTLLFNLLGSHLPCLRISHQCFMYSIYIQYPQLKVHLLDLLSPSAPHM